MVSCWAIPSSPTGLPCPSGWTGGTEARDSREEPPRAGQRARRDARRCVPAPRRGRPNVRAGRARIALRRARQGGAPACPEGRLTAHSGGLWRGARWAPRRGIPAQRFGASARVPGSALREVAGDGPTCTPARVPLDPGARVASAIASGTARLFWGAASCTSSRRSSCASERFGAIAIARSTCASASSPRPVAASTGPRFTCSAASSGRNASPWRYVAMPARRLSTRAPSPCSLGRPAMAVACTTRVAGRLASCGTGNRGTWLQPTPPARGRIPRTALDRRRASNHAPAREARVFDTHLYPKTPLQASRSLSRRRRLRASGEGGCASSPSSDPRRCPSMQCMCVSSAGP